MDQLLEIRRLADMQHGIVRADQLNRLGISDKTWRTLIRRGILREAGTRIAVLAGSTESPEQRILLGVLGTRVTAVASHASAAYLWGALHTIPEGPVDVLTLRGERGYRSRDDCRVHRPVDWMDVGTCLAGSIPLTHPVRTLIDLGATERFLVKAAVERMIIAGHVTRDALERGLRRHSRPGRAGVVALRHVLDEWALGDVPPDSVLEVRFADLLLRRALPPATFHHEVQGFILDAAWPEHHVGAEVDGWGKYEQRAQFQKQVERDALLRAAGWQIVHFTWQDVTRRANYVAGVLRRLLQPVMHP